MTADLCVACGRGVLLPHAPFCAPIKAGARCVAVCANRRCRGQFTPSNNFSLGHVYCSQRCRIADG